ncbi:MAG: TetR/AcrR family transcriptional regulator [Labilithrix sp.]|nr:TetR/AcrR family transcriptional regulator [Labilithrix sp.]MBX3222652.1 TetR/AcrR family transcriptional regulator [Labilithrix sp.]
MSAHEVGKQVRRDRILEAAEELIRRRGDIQFGMRELAEKAGVSPATPFNLFGSKGQVLWALLERDLGKQRQRIADDVETDPVERVLGLARRAVLTYARDERLFRPLLSAVVSTNMLMPALLDRFTDLWHDALEEAEARRQLAADIDPALLARQLHLEYRAGLTLWLRGEVDVKGWNLHLMHGVLLVLRGSMTPRAAEKLHARLVSVQKKLAAAHRAKRSPKQTSKRRSAR